MRCQKIKTDGEKCRAYVFDKKTGLCLFHSKTEEARLARKQKPTTKIQMIKILEKELKNLNSVEDVVARTAEKRRTIQLIQELKGQKFSPVEGDGESDSLEKKLKAWREEELKEGEK